MSTVRLTDKYRQYVAAVAVVVAVAGLVFMFPFQGTVKGDVETYLHEGDVVCVYKWGAFDRSDEEQLKWTYPNGHPEIGEAVTISEMIGTAVYLDDYPVYYNNKRVGWGAIIFMKYHDWVQKEKRL